MQSEVTVNLDFSCCRPDKFSSGMLTQEEWQWVSSVQCGGVRGDKEEVSGLGLITTSCNRDLGASGVSHQ